MRFQTLHGTIPVETEVYAGGVPASVLVARRHPVYCGEASSSTGTKLVDDLPRVVSSSSVKFGGVEVVRCTAHLGLCFNSIHHWSPFRSGECIGLGWCVGVVKRLMTPRVCSKNPMLNGESHVEGKVAGDGVAKSLARRMSIPS